MISGFVPFHGDSILYSCSPWFQSAAETVPNDKWIVAWGLSVLKQELRRPSRPEGSRPRRGWRYCKCNDYCNVLPCIAGLSVAVGLNNIFHIFSWQWVFLADGKMGQMGCLWHPMAPLWPMAIATWAEGLLRSTCAACERSCASWCLPPIPPRSRCDALKLGMGQYQIPSGNLT